MESAGPGVCVESAERGMCAESVDPGVRPDRRFPVGPSSYAVVSVGSSSEATIDTSSLRSSRAS